MSIACIDCVHCLRDKHTDLEVSDNEIYFTFWCTVNACQIYEPRKTTCAKCDTVTRKGE